MKKIIFLIMNVVFSTLVIAQQTGKFKDSRDGKNYKTVKIGIQTWMAENLCYEIDGSYCYENRNKNCEKYGRLYSWEISKKVCPNGWHLPTEDDWLTLIDFAGGEQIAPNKLMVPDGWNGECHSTNELKFDAIGSGMRDIESFDYGLNGSAYWWSLLRGLIMFGFFHLTILVIKYIRIRIQKRIV